MGYTTRPMLIFLALLPLYVGCFVYAMDDQKDFTLALNKSLLLQEIQQLPQDIKRYIIFLLLEQNFGYNFFLYRTIDTKSFLTTAVLSPDGKTFLTGGWDGIVRLWDIATEQLAALFKGHEQAITSVGYSRDSTKIITGSRDCTVRIWDSITAKQLFIFKGAAPWVLSVGLSADNKKALASFTDGTIYEWDMEAGIPTCISKCPTSFNPLSTYSLDGAFCLMGGCKRFWLYDMNSKSCMVEKNNVKQITSVGVSPYSNYLLVGSIDMSTSIYALKTGKLLQKLQDRNGAIYSVASSSDETVVLTGSEEGVVSLWDVKTGKKLSFLIGHNGIMKWTSWSLDGRTILAASSGTVVYLWLRSPCVLKLVIEERKEPLFALFRDYYPVITTTGLAPEGSYNN